MKLISKTLLYYLLVCLPLLVIAGFLSYYSISHELQEASDEALWKEKLQLEKEIKQVLKSGYVSPDGLVHVYLANNFSEDVNYSDTLLFDSPEHEFINHRILTSYINYEDRNYKIEIARPTMEKEELTESLFQVFTTLAGFLIFAFFMVNWLLSKTLWKPFYKTLEKLHVYEVKNHVPENFEQSSTQEFNNLNSALNKMTHKIYADFLQQKEFTENASHEMQTPLAVIKANISLLMQSQHLQAEEMNYIQTIDDTTKKLASLNKALLLLAKIDNNQFKETSIIDISEVANKVLLHFSDLVEAKQIILENKMKSGLQVTMNPVLAEVLLSNLFQNAIRHNFIGGSMGLEILNNEFIISNSGESLKINANELFTRFKKNEASKESLGLGLAIVKSICVLYSIKINYAYQTNVHSFTLKFTNL